MTADGELKIVLTVVLPNFQSRRFAAGVPGTACSVTAGGRVDRDRRRVRATYCASSKKRSKNFWRVSPTRKFVRNQRTSCRSHRNRAADGEWNPNRFFSRAMTSPTRGSSSGPRRCCGPPRRRSLSGLTIHRRAGKPARALVTPVPRSNRPATSIRSCGAPVMRHDDAGSPATRACFAATSLWRSVVSGKRILSAFTDGYNLAPVGVRVVLAHTPETLGAWRLPGTKARVPRRGGHRQRPRCSPTWCPPLKGKRGRRFAPGYPERWTHRYLFGIHRLALAKQRQRAQSLGASGDMAAAVFSDTEISVPPGFSPGFALQDHCLSCASAPAVVSIASDWFSRR